MHEVLARDTCKALVANTFKIKGVVKFIKAMVFADVYKKARDSCIINYPYQPFHESRSHFEKLSQTKNSKEMQQLIEVLSMFQRWHNRQ